MRPLLHFLALGACLYAGARGLESLGGGGPPPVVEISAARVAELRREASLELGRAPSAAELDARIDAEVADELLLREARRRGLGRRDPVVRARLAENMRFLAGGSGADDPDALVEQARRLGLDEGDLVVRRRLIQRMRESVAERTRAPEPGEAELRAHYAALREQFRSAPAARIAHVFFDPARRGAAARADAQAARGTREPGPGDPFLAPRELPWLSESGLARWFGPAFAAAVLELEPDDGWHGPIASVHGLHLVRVHERRAAQVAPFDGVRDAVRLSLLAERAERALREEVARLRARHRVVVAGR